MLHEAKNARFLATRSLVGRRFHFVAGSLACGRALSRRGYAARAREQAERPVVVGAAEEGGRRYWWFRGRFWWEDGGLAETDVMALVLDRERRVERRLERARAMLTGGLGGVRQGIPVEVKRAVWQRCGGRCVECGGDSLLEFDHVIPLAMGGSDGERNLQLLCAECNRSKGASL